MTPNPTFRFQDRFEPTVEETLLLGLRLVEERLQEWTRSPVPFLEEGGRRLLAAGGKRFRPTMCLLSYVANGGRPFSREVLDAGAVVELLHTASLVHDDILDDADARRGVATAHRAYGVNRAILLGDHLSTIALGALPDLPLDAQRAILHAGRLLAEGEAMELELTRGGAATLEDYFVVIAKKTASLVEASAAAGALAAQPDGTGVDAFAEFGFDAGIAFQLVDDILDVEGVTEITGKPTRWDLSRGVPNAAVLATLEADSRGRPAPMRLPRPLEAELDQLLERMAAVGGDERVRRLARMYGARAREALLRVAETEPRRYLLSLVDASLTRLH